MAAFIHSASIHVHDVQLKIWCIKLRKDASDTIRLRKKEQYNIDNIYIYRNSL